MANILSSAPSHKACDFINEAQGFQYPIYGILCDGERFEFFLFDRKASPKVSKGYFPFISKIPGPFTSLRVSIDSENTFMTTARAVCEVIFYISLLGYQNSLKAHYDRSDRKEGRMSTPEQVKATSYANKALEMAVKAAVEHAEGKKDEANELAKNASEALRERLVDDCLYLLSYS
jgi:hypothetical protein